MSDETDLVIPAGEPTRAGFHDGDDAAPRIGKWYWVVDEEDKHDKKWLGAVTHIGTNYVELKGPSNRWTGSTMELRVHFNEFWKRCTFEPNPQAYIDQMVAAYQQQAQEAMSEVRELTARLGVAPREALMSTDEGNQALAVISGGDRAPERYKKELELAQKKTLPDLFAKIKNANEAMGHWMQASLIPRQAELKVLQGSIDTIQDRVFSVELYAGLVEEVVQVRKGAPAALDAKIHLLQRRAYMDEECLAQYEAGGMTFKDIGAFDKWLARPTNMTRILPFERSMIAFQVRRTTKHRDWTNLRQFFTMLEERDADKWTFLYLRNGEQLFRLSTGVEFDAKLFPDLDHSIVLGRDKLWARSFGNGIDDDKIITDAHYQDLLKEWAEEDAKLKAERKAAKPKDRWRFSEPHRDTYVAGTPDSVYHDDIVEAVADAMKKHNRIVLILQGLLDRSPTFHPHPPWQLWTAAGFESALALIYDDSRAIAPINRPDFEAYRKRLNASLKVGSNVVGQRVAWTKREAERENAKHRNQDRDSAYTHYEPYGDPGPKTVAQIEAITPRGTCTFTWTKEASWSTRRARMYSYSAKDKDERIPRRIKVPSSALFNIDAYTPGDFKQFFNDPRTRAEYLQWAPLLLVAEDFKAGKHKDGKKADDDDE